MPLLQTMSGKLSWTREGGQKTGCEGEAKQTNLTTCRQNIRRKELKPSWAPM
jgi:hypothetical protein